MESLATILLALSAVRISCHFYHTYILLITSNSWSRSMWATRCRTSRRPYTSAWVGQHSPSSLLFLLGPSTTPNLCGGFLRGQACLVASTHSQVNSRWLSMYDSVIEQHENLFWLFVRHNLLFILRSSSSFIYHISGIPNLCCLAGTLILP